MACGRFCCLAHPSYNDTQNDTQKDKQNDAICISACPGISSNPICLNVLVEVYASSDNSRMPPCPNACPLATPHSPCVSPHPSLTAGALSPNHFPGASRRARSSSSRPTFRKQNSRGRRRGWGRGVTAGSGLCPCGARPVTSETYPALLQPHSVPPTPPQSFSSPLICQASCFTCPAL